MSTLDTPNNNIVANDQPQHSLHTTPSALPSVFCQPRNDQRTSLLQHLTNSPITIALDTEFELGHTLTIQAAARIGHQLLVHVYHSPAIPPVPSDFQVSNYLPQTEGGYGEFFDQLTLRPAKTIYGRLSPVDLINDLFNIQPPLIPSSRNNWMPVRSDELAGNGDPENLGCVARPLDLVLIGNFWTADFLRVFGREFYSNLLQRPTHAPTIELFDGKIMRFAVKRSGFANYQPVVQFAQDYDGTLYRVTLKFNDTQKLFGPGSLEAHSRTFLHVGKTNSITTEDKQAMLTTFRRKTDDAYGYAIVDAVNTLFVFEQMERTNQDIYRHFGHHGHVNTASTAGRRVADFLMAMIAGGPAKDSHGLAAANKLKRFMARGGSTTFAADHRTSRYGETTGTVHGGLGYSRSPCQLATRRPGCSATLT